MLVLTRREGEGIRIDGDILIHVLEIKGDKIKIGVDAPKETTVLRAEIRDYREGDR
jgi:carbon storage regulator